MSNLFCKVALLVTWLLAISAVDRSKFRKCSDTGFCHKFRSKHGVSQHDVRSTYHLDHDSLKLNQNILTAHLVSAANSVQLSVTSLSTGGIRLRVTESIPRWEPKDILNDAALNTLAALTPADSSHLSITTPHVAYRSGVDIIVLYLAPFFVEIYRESTLVTAINANQLLHFEHRREHPHRTLTSTDETTDRHNGKVVVDYGEDGLAIYEDGTREERRLTDEHHDNVIGEVWEERFGGHTDSKPLGPMSVGVDVTFPTASSVYGIPEHTSPFALPATMTSSSSDSAKYAEPYRLYNLDVFEYELDVPMALYGHIPFMMAHGVVNQQPLTTGLFWNNPTETFIDVMATSDHSKWTHWMSETGNLDLIVFVGASPREVHGQYAAVTGTQALPPLFALGYHQCRWNYRDEKDVATVENKFEELDFPYDVLWLDIEHTDGKRYFTWDKKVFPNPIEMQKNISAHGRKMVTIVDPHIKRDNNYAIHKIATEKGLYVKTKDGADFDGWCWPGSSSYLDFTAPHVRRWWAEQFALNKYIGSTLDLFTWNDMNEPSVFNGPEVSMQKDAKNLEGVEHRYWHNLYGLYMQRATAEGLVLRSTGQADPLRPFVLSRAFWAGSQKYGAIWTGDNKADWGHLKIAAPMLLSINLAGLSFAGADVGGFFGDTNAELFVRWYQAGAFTPFFRGHAHHDTKRKEPWVYGEPYTTIARKTAMLRYSLLPYWYSVFFEGAVTGMPVMRPMITEFPAVLDVLTVDDQWLVGSSLLVKPITDAGATSTSVRFVGEQGWYNFYSLQKINLSGPSMSKDVSAPLETIPVFIRGGSIIPRKMRLRRSSKLMFYDPYTLVIAPDVVTGAANGYLYMDDETTLAHELRGEFAARQFDYQVEGAVATLTSSASTLATPKTPYTPTNTIERITIANVGTAPKKVTVLTSAGAAAVAFTHDIREHILTLKKPSVLAVDDWEIKIEF